MNQVRVEVPFLEDAEVDPHRTVSEVLVEAPLGAAPLVFLDPGLQTVEVLLVLGGLEVSSASDPVGECLEEEAGFPVGWLILTVGSIWSAVAGWILLH